MAGRTGLSCTFRSLSEFSAVSREEWERLDHLDNPFLCWDFLDELERSGSVGPHNGWQPHHLSLWQDGHLAAFAPAYLKTHSRGEFVFDWSWADAYQRHGRPYYPKLLSGIPWSPITGPRLLTAPEAGNPLALKSLLIRHALQDAKDQELSSWHCNFIHENDHQAFSESALLHRQDWQFHWHNHDYQEFEDFLGRLKSRKRKAIRKERRQVAAYGLEFSWKRGGELSEDELAFIYHCYVCTFHAYGNHPALTPGFFNRLAKRMPDAVRALLVHRDGEPLAMGFFLQGGGRLYGRYWGCVEELPGLHFETAYYQGIEHCIREGLDVFESGAQGEHKIARGFIPVETGSYHFIAAADFRQAISDYLGREKQWMQEYREQLARHEPYSQGQP